jgi:hypothetical protein
MFCGAFARFGFLSAGNDFVGLSCGFENAFRWAKEVAMNEPTISAAPDPEPGRELGFHPLVRASGVDPAEAFFCGEQRRYAVFGALVIFTTAMSTAAVFWATTIAVDAPWYVAAVVAAIWAFGIFHIDQWLVSTHVDRPGLLHRLWLLVPRLAIAVPMGLLVAWFAMLGVADKEIQQQLAKDQGTASEMSAERIRTSSEPALRRAELLGLGCSLRSEPMS